MPMIEQIKKYPMRVVKSVALYFSLVALGLSLGVAGPTMLDLKILVRTGTEQIAFILPGRAGGYALGSFLGGILYNYMNVQLLMSISMFLSTLLTFGLALNRTLPGLISTFFLNGICLGVIEAASNIFLIHIWGKENPPFMQALHFAFGLGAFIAPLLARPFLLPNSEEENRMDHSNGTNLYSNNSSSLGNDTDHSITSIHYEPEDVKLLYAFGVIGIYMAINSIMFLYLYINYRETDAHPSRLIPNVHPPSSGPEIESTRNNNGQSSSSSVVYSSIESKVDLPPSYSQLSLDGRKSSEALDKSEASGESVDGKGEGNKENVKNVQGGQVAEKGRIRMVVIVLMTIFMHFYCGLEITFGSFLTAYSVECNLHLTKATGALLTSLFWATFTFFRLFAVFYIDYTGPEFNLVFELILILISNVFLMGWGNSAEWGLWTGTAFLGLGTSSVWASVFGFIEPYFPVTSLMTAGFITSACLGEFIIPAIISNFVSAYPQVFLWVTLVCSVMISVIFTTVAIICRIHFKKVKTPS